MKLGPVTKRDKEKERQKNLVMLSCRDVIVIFPIYDYFGAI